MIITFGRFKGKDIRTLPKSYLLWLAQRDIEPALYEAVVEILRTGKRHKRIREKQRRELDGVQGTLFGFRRKFK